MIKLLPLAPVFLALVLVSPSARAQTPWTLDATFQSATDVVVADILPGTANQGVPEKLQLRVVRVIQGDLSPGVEFTLNWPLQATTAQSRIAGPGGLFFLRKQQETYEPLQCGSSGSRMMPARKIAPAGSLAYTEETPLESKIAREQASVLESLAARQETANAQGRPAHSQIPAMAQRFRFFQPEAVAGIYREFAQSPNIYLRAFGLEGQVQTGDPDAFIALDAESNRLAPAFDLLPLTEIAMSLEPRAHLAAAHALARLALNEIDFGHLDGLAAGILGRAGSLEVLPYLMVMLRSPNSSVADGAVFGVCRLLDANTPGQPSADARAAHCPNPSPPADPAQSQANRRFWLDWWGSHRDEIARQVTLPAVTVPARYNAAPREIISRLGPPQPRNSMALRFGQLLHNPSDPSFDSPQDQEIFAKVKLVAGRHAAQHMSEDRKRIEESRQTHVALEPGALEAGYEHLLETELAECRARLSPTGWLTLEQLLTANPTGLAADPNRTSGFVFGAAIVPEP